MCLNTWCTWTSTIWGLCLKPSWERQLEEFKDAPNKIQSAKKKKSFQFLLLHGHLWFCSFILGFLPMLTWGLCVTPKWTQRNFCWFFAPFSASNTTNGGLIFTWHWLKCQLVRRFTGMKLELMPAIISAAADTFLVLLGNSHELSDTSSTSVLLKIKIYYEKLPFWSCCV